MYPKWLSNFIVYEDEDIFKAHWKLHRNKRILLVCNREKETFQGVITPGDMAKTYANPQLTLKDICNSQCKYIVDGDDNYAAAGNLFVKYPNIHQIPVVNRKEGGDIIDLLTRNRVFWKERYLKAKFPRMQYAYCIYSAAVEAKALGYSSFSVIEFGVAGGNGLVKCEFHAREIARLFGLDIQVYGFDSAEGLPATNMGYKDRIHLWPGGSYTMDRQALEDRLQFAKLVIGDINETGKDFFEKYSPAPVGCMLVDVDYYSSTLPIMKLLEEKDEYFLPRVQLYFDDIEPGYEFSGEYLALKEFNDRNQSIKISPEKMYYSDHRAKTKICHRFLHEKYNDTVVHNPEKLQFPLSDYFI